MMTSHALHTTLLQVTKLTQADHQNTVCLQLKVDRRTAMVVGVNEGCLPVFGDAPASLVQRPLAALCDVFGQWEAREGAGSAVALLQQMYERWGRRLAAPCWHSMACCLLHCWAPRTVRLHTNPTFTRHPTGEVWRM